MTGGSDYQQILSLSPMRDRADGVSSKNSHTFKASGNVSHAHLGDLEMSCVGRLSRSKIHIKEGKIQSSLK